MTGTAETACGHCGLSALEVAKDRDRTATLEEAAIACERYPIGRHPPDRADFAAAIRALRTACGHARKPAAASRADSISAMTPARYERLLLALEAKFVPPSSEGEPKPEPTTLGEAVRQVLPE